MLASIKVRNCLWISAFILILASVSSCDKTVYDLLDPASAGVWTLYNTNTGTPGNQVQDIKLDADGNLWVAFTGKGASIYKDGLWTSYNVSNSSILNNYANSLEPRQDGSILIGTVNGLSLRTSSDDWNSYKDPLVTIMYINTVKVASNGWIWIGTFNQGFYYNDGSGFVQKSLTASKNVNIIEEDHKGNIWLGTDDGLLKYDGLGYSLITTSNGLPSNQISALFNDSKQRLWIGTNGGETVSWIDESGLHQLSLMNGIYGTYVKDIFEDRKGDIWFATWYDGLIRFDGVLPHSFKEYNGFFENNVNSIGEDKDGNLWFGLYSKGIVKYTLPLD